MKISLCTTCMGRAHHLKDTLPANIESNQGTESFDVEFVVVNYNSQDDLDEWMRAEVREHIKSGLVRYFKTSEPEYFNAPHAKNLSHVLATGQVLCNVDADNYLGLYFAARMIFYFNRGYPPIVHVFGGITDESPDDFNWKVHEERSSTFGRICLRREDFIKLGGHDESFEAVLFEDWDLINRATEYGLRYKPEKWDRFTNCINHSLEDRLCNTPNYEKNKGRLDKYYRELMDENHRLAKAREGPIANQGRAWGVADDLVQVVWEKGRLCEKAVA